MAQLSCYTYDLIHCSKIFVCHAGDVTTAHADPVMQGARGHAAWKYFLHRKTVLCIKCFMTCSCLQKYVQEKDLLHVINVEQFYQVLITVYTWSFTHHGWKRFVVVFVVILSIPPTNFNFIAPFTLVRRDFTEGLLRDVTRCSNFRRKSAMVGNMTEQFMVASDDTNANTV